MMNKRKSRLRRATRARAKIRELAVPRLCIYKTPSHIYAQLISPCGSRILASASTLDKDIRTKVKHGGNMDAAKIIGEIIGKKVIDAGVKKVAFDRSGFQYHGRVRALADAARGAGVEF